MVSTACNIPSTNTANSISRALAGRETYQVRIVEQLDEASGVLSVVNDMGVDSQ